MAVIIVEQAVLFFRSIAAGILLGMWYEVFRTLRKTVSHKDGMVHLEDFIFCVTGAVGIFLLFHIYNQGRLRLYVLGGVALGGMLYFCLLCLPVQWLLKTIMKLCLLLPAQIMRKLCVPFKIIMNSILKTLKKGRRTVRIIKSKK